MIKWKSIFSTHINAISKLTICHFYCFFKFFWHTRPYLRSSHQKNNENGKIQNTKSNCHSTILLFFFLTTRSGLISNFFYHLQNWLLGYKLNFAIYVFHFITWLIIKSKETNSICPFRWHILEQFRWHILEQFGRHILEQFGRHIL